MKDEIIVIALGGNAIIAEGQKGSIAEEFANTRLSLSGIIAAIKKGYKIAITHGNGPQAGNMLLRVEAGVEKGVSDRPLGVIVADTEGGMGYMIEQSLENRLLKEGLDRKVVTILAQVKVDPADPQISNPTKPVGVFYSKEQADTIIGERGWKMVEDSGRGWRRVVPSPIPISIVESDVIKKLVNDGTIVITAGGGGIPVYNEEDGTLEGIDAVVDKDYASVVLALELGAGIVVISTGVEKVAINYGKPNQKNFDNLTIEDCEKYLKEGHFPPGSMGPKIKAAINFLKKGGDKVIITSVQNIDEALEGKAGTVISRA